MLGHSGCGAVTGAVDAYLQPQKFWSRSLSPMLRSIIQRIFVAVREAANGLKDVWGPDARDMPGYREALIEIGRLPQRRRNRRSTCGRKSSGTPNGRSKFSTAYTTFAPTRSACRSIPTRVRSDENVRLAHAPTNPMEFHALAVQMADMLKESNLRTEIAIKRAGRSGRAPRHLCPSAGRFVRRPACSWRLGQLPYWRFALARQHLPSARSTLVSSPQVFAGNGLGRDLCDRHTACFPWGARRFSCQKLLAV